MLIASGEFFRSFFSYVSRWVWISRGRMGIQKSVLLFTTLGAITNTGVRWRMSEKWLNSMTREFISCLSWLWCWYGDRLCWNWYRLLAWRPVVYLSLLSRQHLSAACISVFSFTYTFFWHVHARIHCLTCLCHTSAHTWCNAIIVTHVSSRLPLLRPSMILLIIMLLLNQKKNKDESYFCVDTILIVPRRSFHISFY